MPCAPYVVEVTHGVGAEPRPHQEFGGRRGVPLGGQLDEVGGAWCAADASNVDDQGNIVVFDGETAIVTGTNPSPPSETISITPS